MRFASRFLTVIGIVSVSGFAISIVSPGNAGERLSDERLGAMIGADPQCVPIAGNCSQTKPCGTACDFGAGNNCTMCKQSSTLRCVGTTQENAACGELTDNNIRAWCNTTWTGVALNGSCKTQCNMDSLQDCTQIPNQICGIGCAAP